MLGSETAEKEVLHLQITWVEFGKRKFGMLELFLIPCWKFMEELKRWVTEDDAVRDRGNCQFLPANNRENQLSCKCYISLCNNYQTLW